MPPSREPPGIRADMRRSLLDGVLFSMMVGAGETYLPAFVLALGHGEVLAGLVASAPMLAGATLQLISPFAVRRLGSNQRWVTACAVVQASSFAPLVLLAALRGSAPLLIFACAAVYWAAGLGSGPAWTSWFPPLVPSRVRSRYFAYRTRAAQAAVLVGLLAGGWLLELSRSHGRLLTGFAGLFLAAALFRLGSAWLLARQAEPHPLPADYRPLPVGAGFVELLRGDHGRFVAYLIAVQLSVQLAAPYFTPYMLGELRLDYARYVALLAAAFLARAAALPAWGRLAHRIGSQGLLWIGGVGIVPAALPWIVTDAFWALLAAQVLAGVVWGAYELATFLVLFDRLPYSTRTSLLSAYNFANAVALAGGAFLGAALLSQAGPGRDGYLLLFGLTTLLRLAALLALPRVAAPGARPPLEPIGTRPIAVRPSLGGIDRPILPAPGGDAAPPPAGEPAP